MSNFFRRVTGAGHERRESRPDDLLHPQFTREGWDQYVAACTRALNKAFPNEEWKGHVDSLKQKVSVAGERQGQGADDFKGQLAMAIFCNHAEAISGTIDPEGIGGVGLVSQYLRDELVKIFPAQYADGRVPMVSFPNHPKDFREENPI